MHIVVVHALGVIAARIALMGDTGDNPIEIIDLARTKAVSSMCEHISSMKEKLQNPNICADN
jgi:hypothetical protein